MRLKKVLVLCVDRTVASSWYRIIRPLEILSYQLPISCQVIAGDEIDWATFSGVDLVFAMRPGGTPHDEILMRAKDRKIPIISDYDDDIFSVPFSHKDWLMFSHEKFRTSSQACLELSDEVFVTTEHLGQQFKKRIPKMVDAKVIPNAIDDYMFPEPAIPHDLQPAITLWRGGGSHDHDLLAFRPHIEEIAKIMPIVFFGAKPWTCTTNIPRDRWTWIAEAYDPEEFFRRVQRLNAKVQIVPLIDDVFNRSKSNIAWLEGSWFGASAVVGPEYWEDSGCVRTRDQMTECVRKMMFDEKARQHMVLLSQKTIREKYLLSITNKNRLEVFSRLLKL